MSAKITKLDSGIRFNIRVVPKSSHNNLSVMDEGVVKLKINAPPVDGKANQACVKFLASVFSVSKSQVNIVTGLKSKTKIVEIFGNPEELEVILNKVLLESN
ncbi:MAG: DUF167 domain-containing protein [Vampirovibrionia bacterium]